GVVGRARIGAVTITSAVDLLWRALVVFRVGAVAYVGILVAANLGRQRYQYPALAWLAVGLMVAWTVLTAWAYAAPRRRTRWLLTVDLAGDRVAGHRLLGAGGGLAAGRRRHPPDGLGCRAGDRVAAPLRTPGRRARRGRGRGGRRGGPGLARGRVPAPGQHQRHGAAPARRGDHRVHVPVGR